MNRKEEVYVTPQDAKAGRWKAAAAYLGVLVAIPVCFGGGSKFVRFHANQGLVLFLSEVLLLVLSQGLQRAAWALLGNALVLEGIGIAASVVEIVIGILCIAGIVYAVQGRCVRLPAAGRIHILR